MKDTGIGTLIFRLIRKHYSLQTTTNPDAIRRLSYEVEQIVAKLNELQKGKVGA